MERKRCIFFALNDRATGYMHRTNLQRNALGSEYLIRRLKCGDLFVGHEGCVNSVVWNDCGDILLSGSDDCKLNIYKLSSMKPVQSIQSGHQANIFSAKFLPCTADTKIASCSGDGVLFYNDINHHQSYGTNTFRCHTGTTYEVNTTPGDPHTFMSSGEDGTVRLFDLRSKTKCSCNGCKEDVLIECQKAVTSFSVNPVEPYYIAVGCENSLLRVYDRRSMTTGDPDKETDKQRGLLYQFKPKALDKRDCRVTSLKYSSNGQDLLASYCSDYVYLFDSKPKQNDQLPSGMRDEEDGPCPNAGNDPPMKRLRLRGDWSDTGPNARPEGEETVSNEDSFVQRMSGYLTRWIEESIQNARRQRRRNPIVTRSRSESDTANDQDNQEQSDEGNASETLESSLPLTEESRDEQRTETNSDSNDADVTDNRNVTTCVDDVTDNAYDVTNNATSTSNNVSDTLICENLTEYEHVKHASPSRDSTTKSRDRDYVANSHSCDLGTYTENQSNFRKQHRKQNSASDSSSNDEHKAQPCEGMTSCDDNIHDNLACDGNHSNEMRDCETEKAPSESTKSPSEISRLESDNQKLEEGTKVSDNEPFAVKYTRLSHPEVQSTEVDKNRILSAERQNSVTGIMESQAMDVNKQDSRGRSVENVDSEGLGLDGASNSPASVTTQNSTTRKEQQEAEIPENNPPLRVSTRVTIPLNTNSVTPAMDAGSSEAAVTENYENDDVVDESSRSVADDSRRDAAASTIQNFFRFRVKKDSLTIPCNLPVHSQVRQVFQGHRNARTMIKEANFWGDDFILSGSDCGRIFIWSRKTAQVVMLLEGDRHVVNCVQPHPYLPLLATSGIDYDIKLWSPTALNVSRLEDADEVIARNEKMLRESRDTLTVPPSFMIRVLSSLHRVRFHGEGSNQSSGDSDSDLEED